MSLETLVAGISGLPPTIVGIVLWWRFEDERRNQRDRHHENQETLDEIKGDVKRINGTVREHGVRIGHLEER